MLWWTLRQAKSPDSQTRRRAVEKLAASGDPRAFQALRAALGDESSDVRQAAVDALQRRADAPAVAALVEALETSHKDTRAAADKALISSKAAAASPLVDSLKKRDAFGRADVIRLLEQIGPPAVEPLLRALQDPNHWVREAAAEALGKIRDSRALEPLLGALRDSEYHVRQKAAEALGELGDLRALEPLLAGWAGGAWVRSAARALGHLGDPRGVEALLAGLNHDQPSHRAAAAEGLGFTRHPTSVQRLGAALRESEEEVREAAALALGELRDPQAVPALRYAVRDINARVRLATVKALARIGRPAVDALTEALMDSDANVLGEAAEALSRIVGKKFSPALIEDLCSVDKYRRSNAAAVISSLARTGKL